MNEWQPIETAPRETWVLLGYQQQGDEMPNGLMVGVGMYCKSGKIWTMNSYDNEKALPNHWMPLPAPPEQAANETSTKGPIGGETGAGF